MRNMVMPALFSALLVVSGTSVADAYKYITDPGDPVVRPTAAYSEECSCILSLSNGDVSTPDEMEARYRTVDYSPCIPLKSTPSQGMFIYVR